MLAGATRFPGRDDLWRAGDVVLRRHARAAVETVQWIHDVLAQLDFDAPRPVPYFNGASVECVDGAVWSAVSYLRGDIVGWAPKPDLFELGAYLARFHAAMATVAVAGQQTPAFPIDGLPGLVEALERIGHGDRSRHVIHGDFTNHNVLAADGQPCGVIDFANAYVEVPLADVGFALWRSGRPHQDADSFDAGRIAAYVDGYRSVCPLGERDRAAVLVYLRARGVQIVEKQRARGVRDDGPRRKLAWLERHGEGLMR